tara:strand:+ start:829 stop:1008 length:180 start_codon:yes stop_codon:yes gene_type:complete
MKKFNTKWLEKNLDWMAFNQCVRDNFKYWFSSTTRITSMSLGSQKGFVTDLPNAPNVIL